MFTCMRWNVFATCCKKGNSFRTLLSFRPSWRNGASGTSDMDGNAAKVAARESGDEQVQSLITSEIVRDVSTSLDMTTGCELIARVNIK